MLLGFEAPPSAAGVPLALRADIVKQPASIDLNAIAGVVAGEPVAGSAHFDTGGARMRYSIAAGADYISLPSLLGTLVAWQRTPSTEEMLGSIGTGASGVWPSRGFSLGVLEKADGDIKLTAKTLALGTPFPGPRRNAGCQGRQEGPCRHEPRRPSVRRDARSVGGPVAARRRRRVRSQGRREGRQARRRLRCADR